MSIVSSKSSSGSPRDKSPFDSDALPKDDHTTTIGEKQRSISDMIIASQPSESSFLEISDGETPTSPPSSRSQTVDLTSATPVAKRPLEEQSQGSNIETLVQSSVQNSSSKHTPKRAKLETLSSASAVSQTQPSIAASISAVESPVNSLKEDSPSNDVNSDAEPSNPAKLTKRQEERQAKQKLREAEKVEREQKKEEERRLKKEEREKKEQERKQKRELLELEKQEKKEQDRLKREQRRQQIEDEKRAKEQEKKQKEDERKKAEELKNRSQMKIMNFFSVSKSSGQDSGSTVTSVSSPVKPGEIIDLKIPSEPANEAKKSPEPSSYDTDFLPFFQKRNARLAPQILLAPDLLNSSILAFDKQISEQHSTPDLGGFLLRSASKPQKPVTSSQSMVDALNSSQMTESTLYQLVENLPSIKYLQFYENSKPPYVGTWCSEKHLATNILPREPLDTVSAGLDYNYDSDLDWQEGDEGDGEDIDDLDEGDEEEDEVEDDEMEDFVENSESNKRGVVGPLQSVSVWNDGNMDDVFDSLKYERLNFDIDFPIDPFKNYWAPAKEEKTEPLPVAVPVVQKPVASVLELGTPVKAVTADRSQTPNILTPQKPVIKEEAVVKNLVEFIKANSDFSIGTLSELAKKEFKVYTKSILKHTIQEVAFYNKKTSSWEIKEAVSSVA